MLRGKVQVAAQGPISDREITCVSCRGPLQGREGPFVLKYFLVNDQNGALADVEPAKPLLLACMSQFQY
jgi:hypothetical protein